jgi:hypothetical protein
VAKGNAQAPATHQDGSLAWDCFAAFFAARRSFLAVYRRYETRVLRFAREAGVHRDDLVLRPSDLARLFHPRRLRHLRDERLAPLRSLAHGLFREVGVVEPLDTICSHVFHESSILVEEHESVIRFRHLSDPRRYEQVLEEVSGYYPTRLRRIRRLFSDGVRRLEELLPGWAQDRVVVRSAWLFGGRVVRDAFGEEGLAGLYDKMYPEGGEAEGHLVAGRSFAASEFRAEARAAFEAVLRAVKADRRAGRRRRRADEHAAEARRAIAAVAP